jgi:hypothetical protein
MIKNILYNTYPLILHAPGKNQRSSNNKWHKLVEKCLENLIPTVDCSDLTIITWNNKNKGLFEESLDLLKLNYKVLGKGIEDWNNILKMSLAKEALSNIETKWTMGVDSFDAMLLGSPNVVLENFKKKKCKLLFNANTVSFPKNKEWNEFEKRKYGDVRYGFVNAGAWIGETKFCRDFFEDVLNDLEVNEKAILEVAHHLRNQEQPQIKYQIFKKNIQGIGVDSDCSIFQLVRNKIPYCGPISVTWNDFKFIGNTWML